MYLLAKLVESSSQLHVLADGVLNVAPPVDLSNSSGTCCVENRLLVFADGPFGSFALSFDLPLECVCQAGHIVAI
jgi:hypothetical protein